MGEGFNHRLGLQNPAGETLKQAQANAGVGFDGGLHRSRRCCHHFDPGEGHSVIKAVGPLTGQQRQHPEEAVLAQQGHGDLFPRFVDAGQTNGSPADQIHPFCGISGEEDGLVAIHQFTAGAIEIPDDLQQRTVGGLCAWSWSHHLRGVSAETSATGHDNPLVWRSYGAGGGRHVAVIT